MSERRACRVLHQPRATPRIEQRFRYDADGNLAEQYVVGDMDCDGTADCFDIDCFMEALGHCPDPNYPCSEWQRPRTGVRPTGG